MHRVPTLHPLLQRTLVERWVHVRGVRGDTLAYGESLGAVFRARLGEDPIVTMKIEGDDPELTPYASCRCAELSLHTDYATFPEPPRFTITHCKEPDPEFPNKGRSIVVLLEPVLRHLSEREPQLDKLLRTVPVPFRRNAEHDVYHPDVPWHTILDAEDHVRFDRTLIVPPLEASDHPERATLIDAALRFEELCTRLGERVELALDADEVLIIANRKVVHSRSECSIRWENGRLESREVNLAFLR